MSSELGVYVFSSYILRQSIGLIVVIESFVIRGDVEECETEI